ncbi:MAG: hypothetical protein A2148_00965 [Chloroflexi bacterium RBG_16_68_14]|nr:MAG: hypothetical protein A2148_00965 [Chloroflexi bacterium RBG_16_68_14]
MTDRPEKRAGGRIAPLLKERNRPLLTGWMVFLTLLVLTLLEYVVALFMTRNLPLMIVMNVVDAGLIMYFFMHIVRLWREEHGEGA